MRIYSNALLFLNNIDNKIKKWLVGGKALRYIHNHDFFDKATPVGYPKWSLNQGQLQQGKWTTLFPIRLLDLLQLQYINSNI